MAPDLLAFPPSQATVKQGATAALVEAGQWRWALAVEAMMESRAAPEVRPSASMVEVQGVKEEREGPWMALREGQREVVAAQTLASRHLGIAELVERLVELLRGLTEELVAQRG